MRSASPRRRGRGDEDPAASFSFRRGAPAGRARRARPSRPVQERPDRRVADGRSRARVRRLPSGPGRALPSPWPRGAPPRPFRSAAWDTAPRSGRRDRPDPAHFESNSDRRCRPAPSRQRVPAARALRRRSRSGSTPEPRTLWRSTSGRRGNRSDPSPQHQRPQALKSRRGRNGQVSSQKAVAQRTHLSTDIRSGPLSRFGSRDYCASRPRREEILAAAIRPA